jgi:CubicO group peptidase (beta-lactamase class C family)
MALGSIPWIAGTITVVQPDAARFALFGAALGGVVSIGAAVLTRRTHPAFRGTVLILGLLAVGSSPAFVALMARQQPAEPRLVNGPAKAAPTTGADRLRVLQLNADHGYPDREGRLLPPVAASDRLERADRLTSAIARLRPDVVVLQEAWCTVAEGCLVDRLAEDLELHAVYARANGSLRWLGFEEGAAILSRHPVAAPEAWPLLPDRDRFERRIALAARIDHPTLPFDVIGVHVANGDPELADAQSQHLLRQLLDRPERPDLITGDFNLDSDHPALGRFGEAGYRDVLRGGIDHVFVDARASGWWPLWSEWSPQSQATAPISDHPGMLVEFQLPVPPPDDDWTGDWQLVPADQVGLDSGRLEQAVADIGALEGVQGVLVARHGRLVAERYLRGSAGRRPHNMKSASKSVLSALAGLAVAEEVLDLDQQIADLLPEAAGLDDSGKQRITVRHLLTMTSGLESTSFGNYGSWVASRNWVRAALDRPLQAEPGTRFAYSTGGTHLLSATLARAAGRSTHDFAREHLFAALGIRHSAWARDRQGIHVGGNNLSLLPRDMLKFGQLYLNRGRWAGKQLLPWQWVDESTRPGLVGPRGRGRIYGGYGYLWWLRGLRERGAYIASGYGGQYIYVSPAEDLVVVIISTEVSKGRGWRGELFGIIRDGVAGSVIDRYAR